MPGRGRCWHDWLWFHFDSNGVFIPTRYTVTAQTAAGVLEIGATGVSAYAASGIRDVPESPTILLDWEELVGTFTCKLGRRTTLTNAFGGTLTAHHGFSAAGNLTGLPWLTLPAA